MLPKNSLFILSIISDGSINPYSIHKLINIKRRHFRSAIPLQTVYSVIKALLRKELIAREVNNTDNIPAKTLYSITQKGKELLSDNVLSYFGQFEQQLSELQVSLMVMSHLLQSGEVHKETAIKVLRGYRDVIQREISTGEKLYLEDKERGITDYNLLNIENTHNRLTNDLDTVIKFIEILESKRGWDNSPIPFWRNDTQNDEK